ncbi:cytochrome b/b6 domain-containing protein [Streptomyces sp. NPDC046324]|uniref:cytochrome b/b6 domain-containing protein n=1 Tax=Streptomyces sp. NPDC046324 TaxID=3154915 RepID=UPI00340C1B07
MGLRPRHQGAALGDRRGDGRAVHDRLPARGRLQRPRARAGPGVGQWARPGQGRAFGDDPLFTAHVLLGLTVLALLRLGRRIATPLPPWAPTLSPFERSLAHWTEYALLALTLIVPSSGLWLLASGEDELLGVHITAHVLFFAALALHGGLVARHQLFVRDRLLGRML